MKSNLQIFKYCLVLFLGWRVALILITILGIQFFPNNINFDYWLRWANWDGGHFRGIAENNYLPQQTVFFPLYPMLIKFLMFFNISSLWGGLIISNISAIFSLFFLYKLAGKKAIFALLIFPTSFYLGAVYSESLFLAVTLASFYFARKKSWGLSSIFAGLSVATRLVGLATILAIFVEYLLTNKKIFTRKLFYIFSALLPFWIYIIYLKFKFNNSLIFLTSEGNWNRALTYPWVALQNISSSTDLLFFAVGIISLFIIFQKLKKSYFVFSLVAFLIPLFSGTLLSLPRFLLVIFPIFILFSKVENETAQKFGGFISILLLSLYTILFIAGFWIS